MNKFEGVTVLRIDDTDYIKGRLHHLAEQETVTADVVIDGGVIVKNRIFNEVIKNEHSGKLENQINQLANAQKLSAVINAFHFSWDQLEEEDIETLMHVASEYADAIKAYLTEMAEGKK